MMDSAPLLSAVNLHKTYRRDAVKVPVLQGLDLDVSAGEFLSIVGASGSGKSTLLHLLGTIDAPDQGEVRLDGKRIDNLSSERRDSLRNRQFGFIFQFYHLLPELNTLENVLVPQMIAHSVFGWLREKSALRKKATELLESNPNPSLEQIKAAYTTSGVSPILCRCGTYKAVIESVQHAAAIMARGR